MGTDLHYRLAHYEWLVGRAGDADIVAVTGDLADVTNSVPIGVQLVVLEQYLDRLAELAVVLIVSGNHDLDGPGSYGEQLANWLRRPRSANVYSDGMSFDIDGMRFTMCPWWDGPITRDGVGEQLAGAPPSAAVGLALSRPAGRDRAVP